MKYEIYCAQENIKNIQGSRSCFFENSVIQAYFTTFLRILSIIDKLTARTLSIFFDPPKAQYDGARGEWVSAGCQTNFSNGEIIPKEVLRNQR